MSKGSTRSYRNGQKNHWRRTIWNEVLRRTAGREKRECILYLAGPQDNDRVIAIDKGVPEANLIAIDTAARNIASIRGNSGSGLIGDALDVLWSWPANRPVCAVMLDFCSGVEFSNLSAYDAFGRPPLRSAVAIVNFMRGRDPWSNSMRDGLNRAGLLKAPFTFAKPNDPTWWRPVVDTVKHRAYQFLLWHAWDIYSAALLGRTELDYRTDGLSGRSAPMWMPETDAEKEDLATCAAAMFTSGFDTPTFFTYKSGSLTFDSAVFRHHARCLDDLSFRRLIPAGLIAAAEEETSLFEQQWQLPGLKRKMAAMFAWRTRRSTEDRAV